MLFVAQYWPFYCEENVWWLAKERGSLPGAAVFISGARQQVVMVNQSAGEAPFGLLCWDYHVVFMQHTETGTQIVDPDCTVPGASEGIALRDYARLSFPPLVPGWADCVPLFRIIDAAQYVATFASDRRHMRDAQGNWLKPPPPWSAIGEGHALDELKDMSDGHRADVLSLEELLAQYVE